MRDAASTQKDLLDLAQDPALSSRRDALVALSAALTSDEAHHWSRLDLFRVVSSDAVEDPRGASVADSVSRIEMARNIFILVPLLVTWVGISLAVRGYATLVRVDPAQASKPFVELWQNGFSGRAPTFASVGFADVTVIIVVIGLSVWLGLRRRVLEVTIPAREAEVWNRVQGCLVDASVHLARASFDSPGRFNEELTKCVTQLERVGAQVRGSAAEVTTILAGTRQTVDGMGAGSEQLGQATAVYADAASQLVLRLSTLGDDLTAMGSRFDSVLEQGRVSQQQSVDAAASLHNGIQVQAKASTELRDASIELSRRLDQKARSEEDFLVALRQEREAQQSVGVALHSTADLLAHASAQAGSVISELEDSRGALGDAVAAVSQRVGEIEHAFGVTVASLPGHMDQLTQQLQASTSALLSEEVRSREQLAVNVNEVSEVVARFGQIVREISISGPSAVTANRRQRLMARLQRRT